MPAFKFFNLKIPLNLRGVKTRQALQTNACKPFRV